MFYKYHFLYVNVLFDQFKLILITSITIAGFIFAFSPSSPLQVLLLDHGWGHLSLSSRPHCQCLIGSFHPLKLPEFTYPSIADSISNVSPFWPPAAPNTQPQPVVIISALHRSFVVCIYLCKFIWIYTNDLHYHCICYFWFFAFLELPMLNDSWQHPIKIFRTHHWYVSHLFRWFKLILNLV